MFYAFQEIYFESFGGYCDSLDTKFQYKYNNILYLPNIGVHFHPLWLKIMKYIDGNWEENFQNYIKNNFKTFLFNDKGYNTFIYPVKITEEDLFYFKLKIPEYDYDILFSKLGDTYEI